MVIGNLRTTRVHVRAARDALREMAGEERT